MCVYLVCSFLNKNFYIYCRSNFFACQSKAHIFIKSEKIQSEKIKLKSVQKSVEMLHHRKNITKFCFLFFFLAQNQYFYVQSLCFYHKIVTFTCRKICVFSLRMHKKTGAHFLISVWWIRVWHRFDYQHSDANLGCAWISS